jgi:ribosomal-protein-alanine acetyltransferase
MQYPHIRLCVKTPDGIDSMAVNYFVEFDYEIKDYVGKKTGWVWLWESKDDIRTKKGTLYTSIRSPKGILQNMKDQGALEEEFPDEDLRNQAEEILGYAGLQVVLDEGYVTNIAVTEKARKRGIGSALTERILSAGREKALSFVSLEVRASTSAAISLYEKFGFKAVGVRKRFYANPTEDAIIMTVEGF